MNIIKNIKFKQNKGKIYAFSNIIPYAIIPLFFLIKFADAPDTFQGNFAKGAVLTVGKDFLSGALIIPLLLATKKGKLWWQTIKSKAGIFLAIAGIFGGPIGYTLFNTAFYMAGPGFSHVFSSLEPIFLSIWVFLVWNRKLKWQIWLGVVISVIAVISMIAGDFQAQNHSWKIVIGSIIAICGAIAWTIESLLFDRAYTLIGKNADPVIMVSIKMISAIFFNFIIMFPSIGAGIGDPTKPFSWFATFFTIADHAWRFVVAGIIILFARLLYFAAVKYEGSTLTAVIYQLTAILTPILAISWYGITGHWPGLTDIDAQLRLTWEWQLSFWIPAIAMVIGAMLATFYSTKINREKELEYINAKKIKKLK